MTEHVSWKALTKAQRIDEIRKAHPQTTGSAARIAVFLSDKFGELISRNAVIGYYSRYSGSLSDVPLSGEVPVRAVEMLREKNGSKAKPLVRTARQPRLATPKPEKPAVAPKPVDESVMGHMEPGVTPLFRKLFELENNDCRWPVSGEKADTLFCGHPMMEGSSYCCFHRNLSRGEGTRSERAVAAMIKKAA